MIGAEVAVERALSAYQLHAFEQLMGGQWEGARPADYIDAAIDADAYLAERERWWEAHARVVVDAVATDRDTPTEAARDLVRAALVALVALGELPAALAEQAEPVRRLAELAAAWLSGYACGSALHIEWAR